VLIMKSLSSRFWDKVHQGEPDSCWEWQSAVNAGGYGWFFVSSKKSTASHRVSAWIAKLIESLDSDSHVLHECDNRKCCNPKHLFVGTNADNVADRVQKGRCASSPKFGEANGMSKLTDVQTGEIKGLYFSSKFSQSELAKMYGVRQSHISRIVNNKIRRGVM
jgi:hypothetical protein